MWFLGQIADEKLQLSSQNICACFHSVAVVELCDYLYLVWMWECNTLLAVAHGLRESLGCISAASQPRLLAFLLSSAGTGLGPGSSAVVAGLSGTSYSSWRQSDRLVGAEGCDSPRRCAISVHASRMHFDFTFLISTDQFTATEFITHNLFIPPFYQGFRNSRRRLILI